MNIIQENTYSKYFKNKILREDERFPEDDDLDIEDTPPAELEDQIGDDSAEDRAFKDSLDSNTDPEEFETEPNPQIGLSKKAISQGKEWIEILQGFREWINGMGSESLNQELTDSDRDGSVFKGIVRSQARRITKIAEEVAALEEVLKGYLIQAPKKEREINKQLGGY
jgi:hypothetical protein